ncbi:hypothetical protein EBI_25622 [Enterocytozoon bieneusi H348]|nr:hypothetical protein EBI_25622 [Enterocytozoon bieneusi H348]|eukprot:XP_002651343.1 hypothetical protein EBI_25622 [Enterocytozoon bieneusi H348]
MDAALICPNGHIIQNTIVEKEKMECEVVGKKKRIYKLRQKIKKAYHRELLVEGEELLLSLYKLFVEAKSYFEFTTDRFFKFMCGTWRYKDGHQNVVKDSIEIIKDVLVTRIIRCMQIIVCIWIIKRRYWEYAMLIIHLT